MTRNHSNDQQLVHRGQNMKKVMIAFILILFFIGCTPAYHQEKLASTKEREMTVGIVQKEIRVGMSQTEVAEALGSPNIVTRDKNGKESWVYDKIASEASYSKSNVSGAAGGAGTTGNTLLLGLIIGGYESGASSTTQKTLTVVIKFGQDHLVESFSYHYSKF
jgi:outer membrane protein assembly factor BamE (lipoprotein component of BamABCDE complex)